MTIADLFRQEGRQEAMAIAQQWKEEGLQIGHQKALEECALRLLKENTPDNKIITLTGLSLADISALRTKKNTY